MATIREALTKIFQTDRVNVNDIGFVSSLLRQNTWTEKQQNAAHRVLTRYRVTLNGYGYNIDELEHESLRPEIKIENVIDYQSGEFVFRTDISLKDTIKSIPTRKWDAQNRVWKCNGKNAKAIDRIIEIIEDESITVTDAAKIVIDEHTRSMDEFKEEVDTVKTIKSADIETINLPIKGIPYEHQIRGFMIGTTLKSFALLMEQGTGKTYTMISVLGKRFLDGEIDKCIVFCPATVTGLWKDEFEEFADYPIDVKIVNGTKKQRERVFETSSLIDGVLNIRIMSYDSVSSRRVVAKDGSGEVITKTSIDVDGKEKISPVYKQTGGMVDTIISWMGTSISDPSIIDDESIMKRCVIVCDESQRIKNRDSGRTKSIVHLGQFVDYKAILSGTPVGNSPLDFFSQYLFLNQNVLGTNFYQFRNKYCEMGGYKNKEIVGFRNLDDLTERCHSIAFRVTKEEALDLPEFTDQYLTFELKETKKYYDEMQSEMETIIEAEKERLSIGVDIKDKKDTKINATAVISQMTRLSQLAGGHITRMVEIPCPVCNGTGKSSKTGKVCTRCYASGVVEQKEYIKVGEEKLRILQEFVEDFPKHKKLVVVCQFIPDVLLIKERMEKLGRTCDTIYGATPTDERNDIVKRFQNEQNPNILIIQIRTAGLGITLTAADTMIFYSNGFSYMDYDQARARVHRIGQRNFVTYVHLVAQDTIDEVAIEALRRKKRMSDVIVDLVYGNELTGDLTNFEDPDEVEGVMQEIVEDEAISYFGD